MNEQTGRENQVIPISEKSMALYGRLMRYLKPLWYIMVFCLLGYILFGYTYSWFVTLTAELVNMIEDGANMNPDDRIRIPLELVFIIFLRGIGGLIGSYSLAYLGYRIVHEIRCQINESFLELPVRFYDRSTAGHLVSTVTYNVMQVSLLVSEALKVILREGVTLIALLLTMFYLNWQLSLIFLGATPVIFLVVRYASKRFRTHSKRIQISMGDVTHILSESIKGMKVIRSFGAEKQVRDKFHEASQRNMKQNLKLELVASINTPVIQMVVAFALAFLVWLALSPQALESINAGQLVAFILAAGAMLKPIRTLSQINALIQKGLAAAKTIFDLLDQEVEKDSGSHVIERCRGDVSFRNVSFTYTSEAADSQESLVLHDINLDCRAGERIAIVGRSGSGKSTLVNLIPRFYEINQGQILVDGIPHTDYSLHNLRHQISLVSQQVVLFNGSIRDNIAYGELQGCSDEELQAALRHAHALEFITQLPDGLDTMVGDDATLLSGGQRQRLAIARALLKNAPILILDEATSALDSASERHIQAALDTLMQGRTTFVIAHRLSTVEAADMIVVMHEGRIVERGTHRELLALGKHYAELHRLQFVES